MLDSAKVVKMCVFCSIFSELSLLIYARPTVQLWQGET